MREDMTEATLGDAGDNSRPLKTGIIRVSTSLVERMLREGNVIHGRVIRGLPDDAVLLEEWISEGADEIFLVFGTRSGDSRFTGSDTDDAPWVDIVIDTHA